MQDKNVLQVAIKAAEADHRYFLSYAQQASRMKMIIEP